jgi:hemoglobin
MSDGLNMSQEIKPVYGFEDTSFKAAGGVAGIQTLVRDFYGIMDKQADASIIRKMHPDNLEVSIDKLARFLCGWLGGPPLYNERYGSISIPAAHAHMVIGEHERDSWINCMQQAIAIQPYQSDFKEYLLIQLRVPAERVYQTSKKIL